MFKIFIVEDELTIRTELKTLLEKYGYECITTDDFTSVLSAIEATSPHLILLDINLPHFDGYHICREYAVILKYLLSLLPAATVMWMSL